MSQLEQTFLTLWRALAGKDYPAPEREYVFFPGRRWRFDFAWPDHRVAVEVEGGTGYGKRGRHVRPEGFLRDCEKYNAAAASGWRVFRCNGHMLKYGPVDFIEIVKGQLKS